MVRGRQKTEHIIEGGKERELLKLSFGAHSRQKVSQEAPTVDVLLGSSLLIHSALNKKVEESGDKVRFYLKL
jgi:hypothetical protein